jgi:phage gp36-like protein
MNNKQKDFVAALEVHIATRREAIPSYREEIQEGYQLALNWISNILSGKIKIHLDENFDQEEFLRNCGHES